MREPTSSRTTGKARKFVLTNESWQRIGIVLGAVPARREATTGRRPTRDLRLDPSQESSAKVLSREYTQAATPSPSAIGQILDHLFVCSRVANKRPCSSPCLYVAKVGYHRREPMSPRASECMALLSGEPTRLSIAGGSWHERENRYRLFAKVR